jgi:hypothetical protein
MAGLRLPMNWWLVPCDYWGEVGRQGNDHQHRNNHRDPEGEITNPRRLLRRHLLESSWKSEPDEFV